MPYGGRSHRPQLVVQRLANEANISFAIERNHLWSLRVVSYVSFIRMIPEQSVGVVAMANYERTPIRPIIDAALEVLLGLGPE